MALVDHSTSHFSPYTGKHLHPHTQKWLIKVGITDSKISYMPHRRGAALWLEVCHSTQFCKQKPERMPAPLLFALRKSLEFLLEDCSSIGKVNIRFIMSWDAHEKEFLPCPLQDSQSRKWVSILVEDSSVECNLASKGSETILSNKLIFELRKKQIFVEPPEENKN